MNRILQAILGSEAYVAGRSTTKKKVAVPVVLPAVPKRAAELNAGKRVEPAAALGEALISLRRVHFGSESATLQPFYPREFKDVSTCSLLKLERNKR